MTAKSKGKAIILPVAILIVSVSVAALIFSIVKLKKPGGGSLFRGGNRGGFFFFSDTRRGISDAF